MYHEKRPWGAFFIVDEQLNYKVKRIIVEPYAKLSLQSHVHRSEHWTIVQGIATVTLDNQIHILTRGNSIDIPLGTKHRLENLSSEIVEFIEVQFGDVLNENDIIRYEDIYARI